MDYQEIVKKDGKRIVFCNFEELLTEAYGVKSMKEVESFRKPNGEFICHCPFCKKEGHTKHKLYIKSDLTVGHCFVCCRAFIHDSNEVNISYRVPSFSTFQPNTWKPVPLTDPEWSLDRFEYEFDDYSEKGYQYLVGRNPFLKDLWQPLGFKFWNDNIVMPFWYHGEIMYYQIRFTKKSKIRYFFPPISDKMPYIIENGDNKQFIVCEGVYDAVACLIQAPHYTPMAVLGSHISDYQLYFLREYVPNKVLVYMDDTEKSKGVANKVRSVLDYCQVNIIPSDGTDPEENMMERLRKGYNLQWIK
jgi:hypothetical protein